MSFFTHLLLSFLLPGVFGAMLAQLDQIPDLTISSKDNFKLILDDYFTGDGLTYSLEQEVHQNAILTQRMTDLTDFFATPMGEAKIKRLALSTSVSGNQIQKYAYLDDENVLLIFIRNDVTFFWTLDQNTECTDLVFWESDVVYAFCLGSDRQNIAVFLVDSSGKMNSPEQTSVSNRLGQEIEGVRVRKAEDESLPLLFLMSKKGYSDQSDHDSGSFCSSSIQLLSISNFTLETLENQLNATTLGIDGPLCVTDVFAVNEEIFIGDGSSRAIFKVKVEKETGIVKEVFRFDASCEFGSFGLFRDSLAADPRLEIIIGCQEAFFIVDWTMDTLPHVVSYLETIYNSAPPTQSQLSAKFIYFRFPAANDFERNEEITIMDRRSLQSFFGTMEIQKPNSGSFAVNPLGNQVLIVSEYFIQGFQVDYASLSFSNPNEETIQNDLKTLDVMDWNSNKSQMSFRVLLYPDDYSFMKQVKIQADLVPDDDVQAFKETGLELELDSREIIGDFPFDAFSDGVNATISKQVVASDALVLNGNARTLFNPNEVTRNFVLESLNSSRLFYYSVETSDGTLFFFNCTQTSSQANFGCDSLGLIETFEEVSQLILVQNAFGVLFKSKPELLYHLVFYDLETLSKLADIHLTSPTQPIWSKDSLDFECHPIFQSFGSYFVCPDEQGNSLSLFELGLSSSPATVSVISNISSQVLGGSVSQVKVQPKASKDALVFETLFIKTSTELLILRLTISDGDPVSFSYRIANSVNGLYFDDIDTYPFKFALNANRLVAIFHCELLVYSIEDLSNPTLAWSMGPYGFCGGETSSKLIITQNGLGYFYDLAGKLFHPLDNGIPSEAAASYVLHLDDGYFSMNSFYVANFTNSSAFAIFSSASAKKDFLFTIDQKAESFPLSSSSLATSSSLIFKEPVLHVRNTETVSEATLKVNWNVSSYYAPAGSKAALLNWEFCSGLQEIKAVLPVFNLSDSFTVLDKRIPIHKLGVFSGSPIFEYSLYQFSDGLKSPKEAEDVKIKEPVVELVNAFQESKSLEIINGTSDKILCFASMSQDKSTKSLLALQSSQITMVSFDQKGKEKDQRKISLSHSNCSMLSIDNENQYAVSLCKMRTQNGMNEAPLNLLEVTPLDGSSSNGSFSLVIGQAPVHKLVVLDAAAFILSEKDAAKVILVYSLDYKAQKGQMIFQFNGERDFSFKMDFADFNVLKSQTEDDSIYPFALVILEYEKGVHYIPYLLEQIQESLVSNGKQTSSKRVCEDEDNQESSSSFRIRFVMGPIVSFSLFDSSSLGYFGLRQSTELSSLSCSIFYVSSQLRCILMTVSFNHCDFVLNLNQNTLIVVGVYHGYAGYQVASPSTLVDSMILVHLVEEIDTSSGNGEESVERKNFIAFYPQINISNVVPFNTLDSFIEGALWIKLEPQEPIEPKSSSKLAFTAIGFESSDASLFFTSIVQKNGSFGIEPGKSEIKRRKVNSPSLYFPSVLAQSEIRLKITAVSPFSQDDSMVVLKKTKLKGILIDGWTLLAILIGVFGLCILIGLFFEWLFARKQISFRKSLRQELIPRRDIQGRSVHDDTDDTEPIEEEKEEENL